MDDGFRPPAGHSTAISRRTMKPIWHTRDEEVYDQYNTDPKDTLYAGQCSPRPRQDFNRPSSLNDRAYTPITYEEDGPLTSAGEQEYTPSSLSGMQRHSLGQSSQRNVEFRAMDTPSIRLVPSTSATNFVESSQEINSGSASRFERWSRREAEQYAPIQEEVDDSRTQTPSIRQFAPRPDYDYVAPAQDIASR